VTAASVAGNPFVTGRKAAASVRFALQPRLELLGHQQRQRGIAHSVESDLAGLSLTLTLQEIQILDTAYPAPSGAN